MSARKGWAAAQLTNELPNVLYLLCTPVYLPAPPPQPSFFSFPSGLWLLWPSDTFTNQRVACANFPGQRGKKFCSRGKKNIRGQGFGRRTQDLGWPSCSLQPVQSHLFLLFKSFGRCSGFSFHPGECKKLLAQPAFCPHKYSDINIWRSFLL